MSLRMWSVPSQQAKRRVASLLLMKLILQRKSKAKRQSNRRIWTQSYITRNASLGAFSTIIQELRAEDPAAFKNYVRMDERSFDELLRLVTPHIQKQNTNMRQCIPPGEKLALTLRYLATGESYTSLHYGFRIGTSTISEFVPEVCNAIYITLQGRYLQVPTTPDKWKTIADDFLLKWNFPNCMGALDGKHIAIKAPKKSGSVFYNYKGHFSIVLLALVDANYKFIFVDVGCNGRVSDGGVLRESTLQAALNEKTLGIPPPIRPPGGHTRLPYVIVGDEAFPLKDNLMKPYSAKNLHDAQRVFNYRLSRARRVSENAFGILVHRFQIFKSPINLEPEKVTSIVLAAVSLHNYLRTESDALKGLSDAEQDNNIANDCRGDVPLMSVRQQGSNRSSIQAREIRDEFQEYFLTNGQVEWQWDFV